MAIFALLCIRLKAAGQQLLQGESLVPQHCACADRIGSIPVWQEWLQHWEGVVLVALPLMMPHHQTAFCCYYLLAQQ